MPPEKTRFFTRDPDIAGAAVSFTNALTGEAEVAEFKGGVLETSDPGWVPALTAMFASDDHPVITMKQPRKGA